MVFFYSHHYMFETIRLKIRKLNPQLKFLLRIVYPVSLYLLFYWIFVYLLKSSVQPVQLIFILLWAFLEWKFFLSNK